jgi:hypothetical protein
MSCCLWEELMKHGAVMSTGSNRMVTWNTLLVYQERYLLKCVAWCKLSDIPEEQSASIFRVKQWAQQVTSMKMQQAGVLSSWR